MEDEWKIEIKAGSLNYTAQRSSCCGQNGAACNRCSESSEMFRHVSPSSSFSRTGLIGQASAGGFPHYNLAFGPTLSRPRLSEPPIYRDIGNMAPPSNFRIVDPSRMNYGYLVLGGCTKVVKIPSSLSLSLCERSTWISRIT